MGLRISIPLFSIMSPRPVRQLLPNRLKFCSQTLTSNLEGTKIIVSFNTCSTFLNSSMASVHFLLGLPEILILILYQNKVFAPKV